MNMKPRSLIILGLIALITISLAVPSVAQAPKMKMTTDIPAAYTAPG